MNEDKNETPLLSTGDPSTLGSYLKLCSAFFGASSGPTRFIQAEIDRHEKGEDEQVIANEQQVLFMLGQMFTGNVDADEAIEARRGL